MPRCASHPAACFARRERLVAVGRSAVGDEHEQRASARVADRGDPQYVGRLQQPFGERRSTTGRQRLQPPYGGLDAARRRQRDGRLGAGERDEPDRVAPLVRVEQQRDDRRLHLTHPPLRPHRARRRRRRTARGCPHALRAPTSRTSVGADCETRCRCATAHECWCGAAPRIVARRCGRPDSRPTRGTVTHHATDLGDRSRPSTGDTGSGRLHAEQPSLVRRGAGGHLACRGGTGVSVLAGCPGAAWLRRSASVDALGSSARLSGGLAGSSAPPSAGGGVVGVVALMPPSGPPRAASAVRATVGIVVRVRVGRRAVLDRLLELLVVQAGRVEGVAAAAVRQGELGGGADVFHLDDGPAGPGGVGDRSTGGDQVGAHPVDVERRADLGDLAQRGVGQDDVREAGLGFDDPLGELALRAVVPADEGGRVGLVGQTARASPRRGRRGRGWRRRRRSGRTGRAAAGGARPPRGSSCRRGRNVAGCVTDTPSRSTVARPIAAASSSTSTRWSCRRLTSSTYSSPRCAAASRPGS